MQKSKAISTFIAVLLCMTCSNPSHAAERPALPVIVDTDMESDVDDIGAMAMVHALADSSEIDLLGVMVCAKNPWSTLCADRINTYFNRAQLPLGQLKKAGVNRESAYAQKISEAFPGNLKSADEAPDAIELYRKLLAAGEDKSIVILTIGYTTNLRDLLGSPADQHSNLNGKALVEQKVKLWICMGGQFPEGREANIRWDTEASAEAISAWPTEIIFAGWETGNMKTGAKLRDLPQDSPVRRAYEHFGRIPHKSWDQVAVLYTARGLENGPSADFWELSEPGAMIINPANGRNTWKADPKGNQRHLIQKASNEEIAQEINSLMMHAPKSQN